MNKLNSVILTIVITSLVLTPCTLMFKLQNNDVASPEAVTDEVIKIVDVPETDILSEETEIVVEETLPDSMTSGRIELEIEPETEIEIAEEEEVQTTSEPETQETKKEEVKAPSVKPVETVTDTRIKVNKNDELSLLACIIFQEMGGDYGCDDCRRRVADTVLNRVNSPYFPNTIYEVLTQGLMQYGFNTTTGVYWPKRATYPGEAHAVERAYRIAEEVLNGKHSDIYGKDYIWQAEFIQGINNIYCCNTYFGQRDKNKEW